MPIDANSQINSIKTQIVNSQMVKYINRYRLEGDNNFTLRKQRLFFKALFFSGYAATTNTLKLLAPQEKLERVKGVDNVVIYRAYPQKYKLDGAIEKANGILASRKPTSYEKNNIEITTTLTGHDSVFMNANETAYLDSYGESPFIQWSVWAEWIAKLTYSLYNKGLLSGVKIGLKNYSNSEKARISNELQDPTTSVINLKVNKDFNKLAGENFDEFIKDIMPVSNQTLDLNSNVSISDLETGLKAIVERANYIFGIRSNTNFKKERNIKIEFKNDEIHFLFYEWNFREKLEIFAQEYEAVFNKKLTIIDQIAPVMVANINETEGGNDGGNSAQNI